MSVTQKVANAMNGLRRLVTCHHGNSRYIGTAMRCIDCGAYRMSDGHAWELPVALAHLKQMMEDK